MSDADPALAILGGNVDGATAFAVAVRCGNAVVETLAMRTARVDLAILVQQALKQHGLAPSAIREVRVDRGPGSYIGLRVAVTFARTFAAFSGARLLAAGGLEVVATAALRADARLLPRRICVLLDGRQERVQFGTHHFVAGRIEAERAPRLATDADAISWLDADCVAVVDASVQERLGTALSSSGAQVVAVPQVPAATLFAAELRLQPASLLELEPLYLTGSYAN